MPIVAVLVVQHPCVRLASGLTFVIRLFFVGCVSDVSKVYTISLCTTGIRRPRATRHFRLPHPLSCEACLFMHKHDKESRSPFLRERSPTERAHDFKQREIHKLLQRTLFYPYRCIGKLGALRLQTAGRTVFYSCLSPCQRRGPGGRAAGYCQQFFM